MQLTYLPVSTASGLLVCDEFVGLWEELFVFFCYTASLCPVSQKLLFTTSTFLFAAFVSKASNGFTHRDGLQSHLREIVRHLLLRRRNSIEIVSA